MKVIQRHPQVLAFLLLFAANFLGFLLLQSNAQADRDRAYEGSIALCQVATDNRNAIIDYVLAQTEPTPVPANATPEQVEMIRRNNERRANVRAGALDTFKLPGCIENLHLRKDEHGKLVPS